MRFEQITKGHWENTPREPGGPRGYISCAPYGPHVLYMTRTSHLHLVWQGDFESLEAATAHATAKAAEWEAEAA